jgi:hypothetical protein
MARSGVGPWLACGLLVGLGMSAVRAGAADWMTDEAGVLNLTVALADQGGACGATLLVDRNKKALLVEGAPGEIGCKLKLEAAFDDVKSVKTGDGAGFLLELKKGKQKKLVMIPVPHVQWLLSQPVASAGTFAQGVQSSGMRGPDGEPIRVGGAAGGVGPSVKKVEIPKEVATDTEAAVREILAALGRS